jgi:hypothetical protein
MDELALFDSKYEDLDFVGDGKSDRIYRNLIDTGGKLDSSYRIDFGNGEVLEISVFLLYIGRSMK